LIALLVHPSALLRSPVFLAAVLAIAAIAGGLVNAQQTESEKKTSPKAREEMQTVASPTPEPKAKPKPKKRKIQHKKRSGSKPGAKHTAKKTPTPEPTKGPKERVKSSAKKSGTEEEEGEEESKQATEEQEAGETSKATGEHRARKTPTPEPAKSQLLKKKKTEEPSEEEAPPPKPKRKAKSAGTSVGEEEAPKMKQSKKVEPEETPEPTPKGSKSSAKKAPTPEPTKRPTGPQGSATPKPITKKPAEPTPEPTKRPAGSSLQASPTPVPAPLAVLPSDITIEKSGLQQEQRLEPPPPPPPKRGFWPWSRQPSNYHYLTSANIEAIRRAPVQSGRWKFIIVHNSGTRQGNAKAFDYYHRKIRRMKNGLAYHFVIGNGTSSGNGQIEIGDRWRRQIAGGHVHSDYMNNIGLGICLVGDFNRDQPTRAQLGACEELIQYLRERCGKSDGRVLMVRPHREVNPPRWSTDCPGDAFPYGWLAKFR